MQSRQRHSSTQQSRVPPVSATLWHQLPLSRKPQLAYLVAELIRRARATVQDREDNYER